MSALTSKVRIYDLAKELKIDTKRLIEEVRREGVDVSVPSNSVSKELAEKIREKYFPKQATVAKRAIKLVKKAQRPVVEEAPAAEATAEAPVDAEAAPLDAGRQRSRRSAPRGGKRAEGKGGRFDRDFIAPPVTLTLEQRIAGRLDTPGTPGELKPVRLVEGSTVKELAEKLGIKPKEI